MYQKKNKIYNLSYWEHIIFEENDFTKTIFKY